MAPKVMGPRISATGTQRGIAAFFTKSSDANAHPTKITAGVAASEADAKPPKATSSKEPASQLPVKLKRLRKSSDAATAKESTVIADLNDDILNTGEQPQSPTENKPQVPMQTVKKKPKSAIEADAHPGQEKVQGGTSPGVRPSAEKPMVSNPTSEDTAQSSKSQGEKFPTKRTTSVTKQTVKRKRKAAAKSEPITSQERVEGSISAATQSSAEDPGVSGSYSGDAAQSSEAQGETSPKKRKAMATKQPARRKSKAAAKANVVESQERVQGATPAAARPSAARPMISSPTSENATQSGESQGRQSPTKQKPAVTKKRVKRANKAAKADATSSEERMEGGVSAGARPPAEGPAVSGASSADAAQKAESDGEPSSPTKAGKPVRKAILKYVEPKAKVVGVGHGSIAAAAKHETVDVAKLITWKANAPVPFSFLAQCWEEVADTPGRLDIQNLLCNSLRAVLASRSQDLLPTIYLCTGCVAPSHAGIELGVGDSILVKALAEATGRSVAQINKEYDTEGDLGIVAAAARGKQKPMFKPQPLTIAGVHKIFLEIASTQGSKSMDKKKALINKLLVAASSSEAGYIMRALQGKLRIGLGEQAVLNSLGFASYLHFTGHQGAAKAAPATTATSPAKKASKGGDLSAKLEAAAQSVKLAFSQCPSYDVLIPALLDHGPENLADFVRFQPGIPVKPMLAKPMTGVSEVLDKFADEPFTCEYKYDGERAQVHVLPGGQVHIYSRNSEDNTGKYPDIVANIPKLVKPAVTGGVVLDCEAVAYDREAGIILPFQVLSTRARKGVKVEDIKVQVCLYAFDCLFMNGEALLKKPLTERRAALYSSIEEKPGELMYASTKESHDLEELTLFLTDSVTAGTEGLIVKSLDSTYEPSRRSAHWLKLKKDYMDNVGDTFDVVPIGAWLGKGKRKGVYGAYLLAIYNEEEESFQSISKIGTGFSEKLLADLSASLEPSIIPAAKSYYLTSGSGTDAPDVWFDATQVWEVKAADLSISPRHMAAFGMHMPGKGISIRFPRLVRVRDDKTPEQATSAEQVVEMYKTQAIVGQSGSKGAAGGDEY